MDYLLCRTAETLKARGVGRTKHYADINDGLFTKPVKLSPRLCAWPQREISALNAARIAGKSDAQIRDLVRRLEADRLSAE